ncbi:MAG TPA: hypothetical protein VFN55_07115 [Solirubrobacteraceae bacterium]|nr:hypothetical protein [Solirubrobacteraceae bacterium]
MRDDLELNRAKPPVLRRVTAGLVLVAAAALAVWVLVGVIKTILLFVVIIAAVGAVLWALKTLVW